MAHGAGDGLRHVAVNDGHCLPPTSIFLMKRAGLPPTTVMGGTSRVTTLLATEGSISRPVRYV